MSDTIFEEELAAYRKALPDWMEQEGKWVLILGSEIAGVFDSFAQAIDEGYERYGLAQFMVKPIHQVEPVYFMGGTLMRSL